MVIAVKTLNLQLKKYVYSRKNCKFKCRKTCNFTEVKKAD